MGKTCVLCHHPELNVSNDESTNVILVSVPPQCRLSAVSVPPECRLSAASVPQQCRLGAIEFLVHDHHMLCDEVSTFTYTELESVSIILER